MSIAESLIIAEWQLTYIIAFLVQLSFEDDDDESVKIEKYKRFTSGKSSFAFHASSDKVRQFSSVDS